MGVALFLIGGSIYVGATLVLQTIGVFTPNWVLSSDCNSTGLFYFCCGGIDNDTCVVYGHDNYNIKYLHNSLGFHATSLVLMILGLIQMCCIFCECYTTCTSDSSYSVFFIGCYPVSGILSLVGCIIIDIPWSDSVGYSYKLCLTSGIVNGLVFLYECYYVYHTAKSEESEQASSTTVTVEQTSVRVSEGAIRIIVRKTKFSLVSAFRK